MENTDFKNTANSVKNVNSAENAKSNEYKNIAESANSRCIASEKLCDTGFSYTLSLISGKYKMTILYTLMEFTVVRYNELQRYINGISYKTLSLSLKELERDGLIIRKEYPQIPPKVEYSLSERGKSLMPILDGMCEWGLNNKID
ncbi:MAG: helix-turn-helix transcriptional regulator [Clostridia bacterium]|nr:helix-turn-helix transcriptional regulator [Clostridia bacterium]